MNKDSQKDFQELKPGDEIILDDFNGDKAEPQEPMVSVRPPKPISQTEPPAAETQPPPSIADPDDKAQALEAAALEDDLATLESETPSETRPIAPPSADRHQAQSFPDLAEKKINLDAPVPETATQKPALPIEAAAEPVVVAEEEASESQATLKERPFQMAEKKIEPLVNQALPPQTIDEERDATPLLVDETPASKLESPLGLNLPPMPESRPNADDELRDLVSAPSKSAIAPSRPPATPQSIDPILPTPPLADTSTLPNVAPSPPANKVERASELLPPATAANVDSQTATNHSSLAERVAPNALTTVAPSAAFEADLDKLIQSPPALKPQDEKGSQPIQNIPRVSRTFMAFCFLTCCIFLGTIILLLIKFWPNINNVLHSQSRQETNQFEDVLAHLLQVQNQNIEINFVSEEDQDILPHIEDDNIILAEINMTNDVQLTYFNEDFTPRFNADLDFDLQLKGSQSSNNLLLAFSTFFENEEAYFKINKFCIDDCQGLHLDDQYLQRWSNLQFLLQSGQRGEGLSENKSRIFSYLITLFNEYPTYRYLVLLPVFNIVSSQQYIEVKRLLLESQIYNLNSGGCQQTKVQEMSCPLTINYTNLYNFYERVYVDILEKQMPSYYAILENLQLPNKFEIVFDTKEHVPLRLTVSSSGFDLNINYSKFDSLSFDLETPSSLVNLREYYQQILKAEEQIYVQ